MICSSPRSAAINSLQTMKMPQKELQTNLLRPNNRPIGSESSTMV